PDDGLHEVEVPQAPGSAIAFHHLLHRTSEVDVDEVGGEEVGDEAGGLAHGVRFRSEDLDADGTFLFVEPEIPPGALIALADAVGAHELADDNVGPEPAA